VACQVKWALSVVSVVLLAVAGRVEQLVMEVAMAPVSHRH